MRTGRSEALDVFRKWRDEKLEIRCQGSFAMFAFSSDGYIQLVTDEELRMMSKDTRSELVLRFVREMEFGYGDYRTVTGIAKKYDSCIVVFFGPVPEKGTPDSIAFVAPDGLISN